MNNIDNQVAAIVLTKAAEAVAKHYADRMVAKGLNPTLAEIEASLAANAEQVNAEIASIYADAMAELERRVA